MDYPSFLLIFALTLAYALADTTYPDPLQDPDQDYSDNNQDKRTLCAALNKCGGGASRPTYLKRVVYKPQVVRPTITHGGYRYTKPKVQFALKAPSAWKPISSAVKPVVEVVKPETHVDHVHVQPQPGHVHLAPHVDQVHQITVPHGAHYDTFAHVDHLPARPFLPSPVLFEVTRPNLGVLPLGAKFLTPVLKEFPRIQHVPVFPAPVAPVVPAPLPVAPVPVAHPAPPHFHSVAPLPPQLIPQIPHGVSVEYHGTRNYLPLGPGGPVQALPFEHPGHAFVSQQALPHQHHAHFLQQQQVLPHEHHAHFLQQQQALPHEHHAHFLQQQQALPHEHHAHFLQQQQEHLHQYQDIPQGQLPLEGEEGNAIQPGQTDLQIPYHLPQHGAWPEDFRPSPQTPYHK